MAINHILSLTLWFCKTIIFLVIFFVCGDVVGRFRRNLYIALVLQTDRFVIRLVLFTLEVIACDMRICYASENR